MVEGLHGAGFGFVFLLFDGLEGLFLLLRRLAALLLLALLVLSAAGAAGLGAGAVAGVGGVGVGLVGLFGLLGVGFGGGHGGRWGRGGLRRENGDATEDYRMRMIARRIPGSLIRRKEVASCQRRQRPSQSYAKASFGWNASSDRGSKSGSV